MDLDPEIPPDDASLESLLRQRRLGPVPPSDSNPWDFLQRWPASVLAQRAWPVISRLIVDRDEAVRARSLEFVNLWSDGVDVTAPRVLEVGERQANLFGEQEVDGIALRQQFAQTASMLAMYHDGARFAAMLRRLVADGPVGGGAAAILAQFDPDFVIDRTKAWGRRAAAWATAAAPAMAAYRRDRVLDFLHAASAIDDSAREQILAGTERVIRRDDAAAAEAARSKGLPAPTRPAPTAVECRRAIGL